MTCRGSGGSWATVAAGALPWLTVEQMREVDRIAIEELGLTLERMMENAGRHLAELARRLLGGASRGSGLPSWRGRVETAAAAWSARHLANAGGQVRVALSGARERLAPGAQLAIAERSGVPICSADEPLGDSELAVDALLGYSQSGTPRGGAARLIEASAGRRIVALDVPSGLELTTGVVREPHVGAEATLTLAAPKAGLVAPGAGAFVGALYLADISIPPAVFAGIGLEHRSPFGSASLVRVTNLDAMK